MARLELQNAEQEVLRTIQTMIFFQMTSYNRVMIINYMTKKALATRVKTDG